VQSPVQTDNFRRQKPPKKQENAKKKKGGEQEHGKDTYVYALDGNLYINLTNKCCNGCEFCVRNERSTYYGHSLWLRHGDPTAQQVISAIEAQGDLTAFQEFVFCGFGEPTYRMEELRAVCDYLKQKGLKTRLNTNGQGNLVNKRDILPDLKGRVDMINVSLNAPDAESYKKLCRPMFGEAGFAGMIDFAKTAKRMGIPCRFSVVDCIGEDSLAACKKLSQDTNVPLYIRSYITDSGE
jgi:TatD family-associated radical SAM protein